MPAEGRTLSVSLSAAALDRPYLRPARDRDLPLDLTPIRGDGSLTTSLRAILPAMLEEKRPDLEELADLAGTSRRTFQRRLAEEGATLSGLIDDIRRDQALARLSNGREPVASISAELGYSDQSCLTRAMRRWTNAPPSRIRRG
jgi:AraC-like DNA-binding protein